MHDTIMVRFAKKQKTIQQHQADASLRYPALWSKMIAEWNTPEPYDRVWLTYSANYLFRTDNIRWAIDPLTMNWRIAETPKVDAAHDLSSLSFVLLTHDHNDHLDIDLLYALRDLPITWVVPEFILSKVIEQAELPQEKIIVPSPLTRFELNGMRILPFNGLHREMTPEGNSRGVPSMGYLIECNGKRWLFPGDTRTYDAFQLPALDPVDIIFAHLWLGRGSALMEELPLLDAFCRFFLDLGPRRLILTHLHEYGRDGRDFWDVSHALAVSSRIEEINPGVSVIHACMGESILL